MKKRRKQLPLRQVSGRSENHEDAGFGNAFVLPAMLDRPQRRRDFHIDLPCFLAKSTGRQQLPAAKPSRVAGSHEDGDWIDIHDLAGLTERCLRDKQQILIAPHSSLHPLIWSDADWACGKASIAAAVDLRRP